MRTFIIKPGDLIPIGRAGENQATEICFDVTGWADTFGAGTFELIMQRPGDSELPYPVEVTVDGDYVVWTVSNVDTGIAGNCKVQLRYVVSDAVAKSVIYRGIVGESLDHAVDPPDPYDDLIERIEELARQTEQNAEAASRSAGNASDSADAAGRSAGNASDSADAAGRSANNAAQSVTDANAAKLAAQAAQQYAEAAQAGAEAAEARIMDTVPDAVTNWLNLHVDPATGYVIDDSLTIANAAADAKAVGDALVDKAPIITDTASGAIASFPDGSDAPIKQLTVGIEPQQDLHGYDNPWPAGGGKNLRSGIDLANDFKNRIASATIDTTNKTVSFAYNATETAGQYIPRNVTFKENTQYTFIITVLNPSAARANLCIAYTDGTISNFPDLSAANAKETVTVNSTANKTVRSLAIKKQGGSSTIYYDESGIFEGANQSWTPYENICPITGWTGANVVKTGANLFDITQLLTATGWTYDSTTGEYSGTSANLYYKFGRYSNYLLYFPNGCDKQLTFALNYKQGSDGGGVGILFEYTDGTSESHMFAVGTDYAWRKWASTAGKTIGKVKFTYGSNKNLTVKQFGIFVDSGSTDADKFDYAYTGQAYPISWQSEAGTVYGGHWTANQDGSASLSAEWANIASYAGEALPGEWISDRDVYAPGTTPTTGAQVVYKLATPLTYTLTALQVTTLLGTNNIWADTGDVAVEYRADTKLYIDKKLAALLAALS